MDLEASLYGELIEPVNGAFAVPTGTRASAAIPIPT